MIKISTLLTSIYRFHKITIKIIMAYVTDIEMGKKGHETTKDLT